MEEYLYTALLVIGALILIAVTADAIHQRESAEARRELLHALKWADKDALRKNYSEVLSEIEYEEKKQIVPSLPNVQMQQRNYTAGKPGKHQQKRMDA